MALSSTVHAPERSKVEQIVVEFFAKSLHIILESRMPALGGESDSLGSSASSSASGPKTRDRWFNLALGDCTTALENFEPWRRSFSDPMIVDILLNHSKFAERAPSLLGVVTSDSSLWAQGGSNTPREGSSTSANKATVLERWTVQFEQRKRSSMLGFSPSAKGATGAKLGTGRDAKSEGSVGAGEAQEARIDSKEEWSGSGSRSQKTRIDESPARGGGPLPAHVTEVSAVYKRTVVMLRSLYSKCRLLPAYRMFRISSAPNNCCDFSLSYRVLSSAAPLTEQESRDMPVYSFTPVETAFGRMCLSVAYRLTTDVIALEVVPSILPCIIPDYVGSPTTDPLKRFTGEPHSLPASGTSIRQGMHMVSVPASLQNSPPPGLGLGRRHSWSGRINQMQPALQPPSSPSYRMSRSPSPSPSYPFHPSPPYPPSSYSPYSQKHPSSDLSFSPLSSPLFSADRHAGTPTKVSQPISIENRCSPPFSPSPSPSPPTMYRGGSAPVSIPKPSQSRGGSKLLMGDTHQRTRSSLPPLSPSAKKAGVLLRSSSESPKYSGQLLSSAHQSRSFESPLQFNVLHGDHGQQVWMNEGPGPYTTENLLYGQSQRTLSRSSSKTALGDDGEDDDFSCPFAVDDVDTEDKRSSKTDSFGLRGEVLESSASSGSLHQRSPDAAVGALIRILKSAPPLRHSFYSSGETPDSSVMFGANEREFMDRIPGSMVPESSASLDSTSSRHARKIAAEALEELQLYKNMRDLMHKRREEARQISSGSSTSPG
eukprot:c18818_g1_i2 orf=511-2814(+)